MKKLLGFLLAFVISLSLWCNFAPAAKADLSHLTPCSESPAFQAKSKTFRDTTADPNSGENRAARYSQALCGEEGYPHLIVDGRLSHAGDFAIPAILFLYIAGWIGWAGRSYLIAIREEKDPEMKEIIIDVPLALSKMLFGFLWPLQAIAEFTTGKLVVKDEEISVSPR